MRIGCCLVLAACGSVNYTDPNAPRLFRSTVTYTTSAQEEPLVWMPLIDLFDESGINCTAAQAWLRQAIRSAVQATSHNPVELEGALVSPGCDQQPSRTLDVDALRQQIADAAAARPTAHVKALVVYANNISLPAPAGVVEGLSQLRASGFLWLLARAAIESSVPADAAQDWTFTYDATLSANLSKTLAPVFPLISDAGADSGPQPILGRDDLPHTQAVKICKTGPSLSFPDVPRNGTAFAVNPAQPPHYRVTFPQQVAVPHANFSVQKTSFEIEGCSANCAGYFSSEPGDLRRWDQTRGCFLVAP